jgi:hypothetical protein
MGDCRKLEVGFVNNLPKLVKSLGSPALECIGLNQQVDYVRRLNQSRLQATTLFVVLIKTLILRLRRTH